MPAERTERSLLRRVFEPDVASVAAARHHLDEFLSDAPDETGALATLLGGTARLPDGKVVWFELPLVQAEPLDQPGDLEHPPNDR